MVSYSLLLPMNLLQDSDPKVMLKPTLMIYPISTRQLLVSVFQLLLPVEMPAQALVA